MPTKGRVQVAPGQVIQSSQWGNPLWDQSVQCFANAADRTTQYPSPHDGSVSYLADTKRLEQFTAGAWAAVAPAVIFQGAAVTSPVIVGITAAVTTDGSGKANVPISPPLNQYTVASVTDATGAIAGPVLFKADFANSTSSTLRVNVYGTNGAALPGYAVVPSVIVIGR